MGGAMAHLCEQVLVRVQIVSCANFVCGQVVCLPVSSFVLLEIHAIELHWGTTLRVTGRCMRPVLWLQILQPPIWANCWHAAKGGWQFVACWQWQGVLLWVSG